MKTLIEHNHDKLEAMSRITHDTEAKNGIACPECGVELFDKIGVILTSMPPQYPVFCKACGYRGSRY